MTDQTCELAAANATPSEIADLLRTAKVIAVVGLSPAADRDSNTVARYLLRAG